MKNQEFTSKNTSINSNKLPTAFHKFKPDSGERVLDYGCGRFWANTASYCYRNNVRMYLPYDKYNCSDNLNASTLDYLKASSADRVYCCNVLNVIKEDEIVQNIVDDCIHFLCCGGVAIFQIYTGNNSGVGSVTKADCYQRNSKGLAYKMFFEYYINSDDFDVILTNNFIRVIRRLPF